MLRLLETVEQRSEVGGIVVHSALLGQTALILSNGRSTQTAFECLTNKGSEMSDCLHCDINQLVQQRLECGNTDPAELASMIAESIVDLILLAPEDEQPNLMAYVLSGFGQMFLEKSGAAEGGSNATH